MVLEAPVTQRVINLELQMGQAWQAIYQLSVEMREFKDEMREFKDEMLEFKDEMRDFKDEMRDFKDEMRDFKDEMREFKNEMQGFKNEMQEFKNEMQGFKDEMRDFKDEMKDFKDEMKDFKDEMQDFKEESRRFQIESRKQWGELANKMGTMAEDLVAPSVGRILRETVGCPGDQVERVAVRMRVVHPADRGRTREFDVIAVCGDYVLVNETRSRLDAHAVQDFAQRMPEAREFLPEYAGKQFIGAIASLYVDESIVRCGEKEGLIVLGFGEDVMDVLNSPGFKPKPF